MPMARNLLQRYVRSMAYDYVLLRTAQTEYAEIVHYLFVVLDSPQAATHFADEFDKQLTLICDNPQLHALSRMPELAEQGYRPFLVNNYVVLYKVCGELVVVSHIFHQTQNYAKLV